MENTVPKLQKSPKQEMHGVKTDRQLIELGIRPPRISVRYPHVVKTKVEKEELRKEKHKHNQMLIKAGFSPKKRLNISEPMTTGSSKHK